MLTVPSSIFGKAVGGLEVIHSIEQVPVDKNDKPWDPVIMHSLECSSSRSRGVAEWLRCCSASE
jgi:cyclophilin family peptidyl-prolyl cis-trans isomerase